MFLHSRANSLINIVTFLNPIICICPITVKVKDIKNRKLLQSFAKFKRRWKLIAIKSLQVFLAFSKLESAFHGLRYELRQLHVRKEVTIAFETISSGMREN
jgi:hypothetical protein